MILPDGNILIAFKHLNHADHAKAKAFFSKHPKVATCPITELNLVRGLMQLGYTGKEADALLADLIAKHRARLVSADISAEKIKGLCQGHRETTDAYLAELARAHDLTVGTVDKPFAKKFPDIVEVI